MMALLSMMTYDSNVYSDHNSYYADDSSEDRVIISVGCTIVDANENFSAPKN